MNKSFYIFLVSLSALIATGGLALSQFAPHLVYAHTWYLLVFFIVVTLLTHWLMVVGTKDKDPLDTYNATMGATAIRLVAAIIFLAIHFYLVKENRMNFVFTFFLYYFIFLGFEIRTLLANLPTNSK